MDSMKVKQAPQIDNTLAVEEQQINRCTAYGRESDDQCEIVTPGKMTLPLMLAWMVERHHRAAQGVSRIHLVILVVVTALAGQSQVVQTGGPATRSRYDVFHGE